MSAHDYKSAERPAPDKLLTEIADYVLEYQITSELAFDTARFCLMDSLAWAFPELGLYEAAGAGRPRLDAAWRRSRSRDEVGTRPRDGGVQHWRHDPLARLQ
jgi:hypothetical protein